MRAPALPHVTLPAVQDASADLTLHPMMPDDAAALGAEFAAMTPWSVYPYSAEALSRYLSTATPGAPRYLVRCNDEPAGAIGLQVEWLRGPYIQFLGLRPAFQSKGIGSRLLRWIETEARATAQRNLWVAASHFNDGALSFYRKAGFLDAAPIPDLVADGVTEILLRKRLM